jgi:5-formyltetrahydrofolate cyclo-ligase
LTAQQHVPAGAGPIVEAKAAIRAAALARRDALSPRYRSDASARIQQRILALPAFDAARIVMAYSSFGSELDTSRVVAAVYAAGKALVLPRIDRGRRAIELFAVGDPDADLVAGAWGIREPRPDRCTPVSVSRLEFVLVPGVAFDSRGGRLGYGRGYYDKLFHECELRGASPFTAAGAFDVQIVDDVPMEPHDVRVDCVVTESCTESLG